MSARPEDSYIDLGITDAEKAENGMILAPNVQGVVYHRIDRPGYKLKKLVRAQVIYPMFGDMTALEWCQYRLEQARTDGLITKWELLGSADNPSGITRVRFSMTAELEYPVTDAPEEQHEVILYTLQPLINKITNDVDAQASGVEVFDI